MAGIFQRYIDHALIISSLPKWKIDSFITKLNQMVPYIKFSLESNGTSVIFLDFTIYKGKRFYSSGLLDFKLYQKPLNAYLYVPYTSEHPIHTLKSFIQSELNIYIRTNSDFINFLHISALFLLKLKDRGYPFNVLNTWFLSMSHGTRDYLIWKQYSNAMPSPQCQNILAFQ